MWRSGVGFLGVVALTSALTLPAVSQQNMPPKYKIVKIPAGQTVTIWTGVNVTGRVFLAVRTRDKTNSVRIWWLKHPFGRPTQLGDRSGDFDLAIPSVAKGAVAVQLRAKAHDDTVIYIGENVALGHSLTFNW